MSRNRQRQKVPKASVTLKVKAAARRRKTPTPSPDASGDDGYSALENLSDSDDEDEKSVQAAEGDYIIKEVQSGLHYLGDDSPRPPDDGEDDGDDEDDGYEDEGDDDEDEDEAVENQADDDDDDDESSWNGIPTSPEAEVDQFAAIHGELSSPQSQPGRKVVRFANVPDESSDDDTDTDQDVVDGMFPDIFCSVDALPNNIRRQYEQDSPNDDLSAFEALLMNGHEYPSTAESDPEALLRQYDTDTPIATPIVGASQGMFVLPGVSMPVQAMAQSPELDGYETDGDTTEDDIPSPSPAPVKKKTRRPDAAEEDDASDTDKTPIKSSKGQPRVGHFNLDKSGKKPIAVLDPITKRMLIFTPHKRGQLDLSPELFHHANYPVLNGLEQSSPIGTNDSTPVSMNAMFSGGNIMDFDSLFSNTANIDWTSFGNRYIPVGEPLFQEMGLLMSGGADEGEQNLDIDNFIADGWADETDGDETDARPSAAGGASDLDVMSDPFGLDFGQEHAYPLLNDSAILDLDFDIANVLGEQLAVTPKRRRRSSAAMPPPSSPIVSILQKRKSVGDHPEPAHKRQRSITTDVARLTV